MNIPTDTGTPKLGVFLFTTESRATVHTVRQIHIITIIKNIVRISRQTHPPSLHLASTRPLVFRILTSAPQKIYIFICKTLCNDSITITSRLG